MKHRRKAMTTLTVTWHDMYVMESMKHRFDALLCLALEFELRNRSRRESEWVANVYGKSIYACCTYAHCTQIPTYILIRHRFFFTFRGMYHTNKIESESHIVLWWRQQQRTVVVITNEWEFFLGDDTEQLDCLACCTGERKQKNWNTTMN